MGGSTNAAIRTAFLEQTSDERTGANATGRTRSREDLYEDRTKWPRS